MAAPPVYRPANTAMAAPAVYRPNVSASLQRKPAIAAPPVYRPTNTAMAAPAVYRPNSSAPVQRKPEILVSRVRQPQSQAAPSPIAPHRITPQARPTFGGPAQLQARIIQRVTYKSVVYRPDDNAEQLRFFEEAKRDMGANWAPGRSENYIKEIGLSDEVITNAEGLRDEKKKKWKDFDKAVNTDLEILGDIEATILLQAEALEGIVPQLTTSDKSGEVNTALRLIAAVIQRVPAKWNIEKTAGFNRIETIFKEYLKLSPWVAVPQDLLDLRLKSSQGQLAKKAQNTLEKGETAELGRQDKLRNRAAEIAPAIVDIKQIAAKLREKIRSSAADQFERGKSARVSAKSSMKNKKLYLGEIETTKALKQIGDKGRGVLWASPWSPGVNTAFLEGGVAGGSVFKLKTPIPAQLKQLVKDGDSGGFKAAVKDKTTSEFWPFWNSLENPQRFTIYTEELVYLMDKGYRLHEFKRKGSKGDQQVMVAPGQLSAVSAAYSGR